MGNAYVHSTFNNVIITITNEVGDVIRLVVGRQDGFPWFEEEYSVRRTDVGRRLRQGRLRHGPAQGEGLRQGSGAGRESAVRTIHGAGIEVMEIIDVTPLPHNGCRAPNRRRV